MTDFDAPGVAPDGFLTPAQLAEMRAGIDAVAESQRRLSSELGTSGRLGLQFGRSLTSAFVGLAVQGKSFGDVLRSLALSLSRLVLSAAFKPLESAFGAAIKSVVGGAPVFSASGSVAAPSSLPAVIGAGVAASKIAGASEAMLPATGVGVRSGAGPSVVLNVTTPDADSFRRSETQLAALIARAVGQGQRNL
jgi:hypothetical protein